MKTKHAAPSFMIPRFVGRTEADMTARGLSEQLELFRATLNRPAKLQVLAMLALSDPQHLDHPQSAKVANIAETMGYQRYIRTDGKSAFPTWVYEKIEETGLKLRQKAFEVYVREPSGFTREGRRKWKVGLVELSILQEFGFLYEDQEGQPVNLDGIPKGQLINYEAVSGSRALYAIPMTDEQGNFVRNKDGTTRRRLANGVTWTFASRFARLAKNRETSWVFFLEALQILRRYLSKPRSFDLMFMTLFWKSEGLIEISHSKLVRHLDMKSKDAKRVQADIVDALQDALNEGIIDKPPTIREAGYYRATGKTGRPRRKDKVYQWQRAAKWKVGIIVTADQPKPYAETETQELKS